MSLLQANSNNKSGAKKRHLPPPLDADGQIRFREKLQSQRGWLQDLFRESWTSSKVFVNAYSLDQALLLIEILRRMGTGEISIHKEALFAVKRKKCEKKYNAFLDKAEVFDTPSGALVTRDQCVKLLFEIGCVIPDLLTSLFVSKNVLVAKVD
jgi:hypothetical protein